MSPLQKAGIAMGVIAGVAVLAAVAFFIWKTQRSHKDKRPRAPLALSGKQQPKSALRKPVSAKDKDASTDQNSDKHDHAAQKAKLKRRASQSTQHSRNTQRGRSKSPRFDTAEADEILRKTPQQHSDDVSSDEDHTHRKGRKSPRSPHSGAPDSSVYDVDSTLDLLDGGRNVESNPKQRGRTPTKRASSPNKRDGISQSPSRTRKDARSPFIGDDVTALIDGFDGDTIATSISRQHQPDREHRYLHHNHNHAATTANERVRQKHKPLRSVASVSSWFGDVLASIVKRVHKLERRQTTPDASHQHSSTDSSSVDMHQSHDKLVRVGRRSKLSSKVGLRVEF